MLGPRDGTVVYYPYIGALFWGLPFLSFFAKFCLFVVLFIPFFATHIVHYFPTRLELCVNSKKLKTDYFLECLVMGGTAAIDKRRVSVMSNKVLLVLGLAASKC